MNGNVQSEEMNNNKQIIGNNDDDEKKSKFRLNELPELRELKTLELYNNKISNITVESFFCQLEQTRVFGLII